ncbi:hypothetical protein FACS1894199_15700 [Bacteroidia bacterium]|nr:hypothetical protein FACS1894199_15700 [Bacteroidia bacterium]
MPEDYLEMNTTTPFTQLFYTSAGSKGKAEMVLDVFHTQNIRPYWNVGFRYHLFSGDGRYMNSKSKAYNFAAFTSYERKRLAFSVFYNQNNAHIGENGGIVNRADVANSDFKPEDIASNLAGVQNTVRNLNIHANVQYNIGRGKKRGSKASFFISAPNTTAAIQIDTVAANSTTATIPIDTVVSNSTIDATQTDTINATATTATSRTDTIDTAIDTAVATDTIRTDTVGVTTTTDKTLTTTVGTTSATDTEETELAAGELIYPFKAILTAGIENDLRRFKETQTSPSDSLFFPRTLNYGQNIDITNLNSYKIGGKFVVNEHPKYTYLPGLYAGIDFEHQKYIDMQPSDTSMLHRYTMLNGVWLNGGVFNVDTAAIFTYDLRAKLCTAGDYIGNFAIDGFFRQYLHKNKQDYLHVSGLLELKRENHFYNYFFGNHNTWENNFNNTKTLNLKGAYVDTRLRTELGIGLNNIIDYIYMNENALPEQTSTPVMILTAFAKQSFTLGYFHFEEHIFAQKSNHDDIIELPLLSLYSHNYFQIALFKKALGVVAGIDVFYNTKFYADKYAPDLMAFYKQREAKTGNYPKVDVFIDLKITRAHLFMKYEHVNYHISNHDSFTALNYPLNPALFKFGVVWDFFD